MEILKQFTNFESPTAVQEVTIPLIMEGRDVMMQSPTGSGKTLAYLLPIFARIDADVKGAQGVVIAPTYELASQIAQVAKGLTKRAEDVALLIGGAAKNRQEVAMKVKPRLVVGSSRSEIRHPLRGRIPVACIRCRVTIGLCTCTGNGGQHVG